jgi:hypothetical protein
MRRLRSEGRERLPAAYPRRHRQGVRLYRVWPDRVLQEPDDSGRGCPQPGGRRRGNQASAGVATGAGAGAVVARDGRHARQADPRLPRGRSQSRLGCGRLGVAGHPRAHRGLDRGVGGGGRAGRLTFGRNDRACQVA